MAKDIKLTGKERIMADNDIIVSKTDLKGRITYSNDVFCNIADYTLSELIGSPHSLVRHPDMPRCVFKFLWDQIQAGKEIFAYVVNTAKNGDHYWVLAHVTATIGKDGNIVAYHSSRRKPTREAIESISGLYKLLINEEKSYSNSKEGMQKGFEMLAGILEEKNISYDEFVLSL